MFARLACAAALLLAGLSSASAINVVFAGGGFVTAATAECSDEVIFQGVYVTVGYFPANQGDNGGDTNLTIGTLPQLGSPFATHLSFPGVPTGAFVRAKGTTVSALARTYNARVDIGEKPTVEADTQNLVLTIKVKNLNGVDGCDATINVALRRAPF